ncbi:MAG: hypothetical protein HZA54_03105 [Planctomycetes bacterium]|nr:hypothetical protein [Planctomycetota bacterium]
MSGDAGAGAPPEPPAPPPSGTATPMAAADAGPPAPEPELEPELPALRAWLQAAIATVGFGIALYGLAREGGVLYDEARLLLHGVDTAGVVVEKFVRDGTPSLRVQYPDAMGEAREAVRPVQIQLYGRADGALLGLRYLPENPDIAHLRIGDIGYKRAGVVCMLSLVLALCVPWVLRRAVRSLVLQYRHAR